MKAEELGLAIYDRRKMFGLRQQELADLSGVSERFIRDLEKGKPSAQLDKVIAVLETLGAELQVRSFDPLRSAKS